jgi:hypothetical protein
MVFFLDGFGLILGHTAKGMSIIRTNLALQANVHLLNGQPDLENMTGMDKSLILCLLRPIGRQPHTRFRMQMTSPRALQKTAAKNIL